MIDKRRCDEQHFTESLGHKGTGRAGSEGRNEEKEEKKMSEEKPKNSSALRYAGWGTQMLVLLGLAVWGGIKLDQRIGIKALFVVIFPMIALIASLYQLIKTLNKNK